MTDKQIIIDGVDVSGCIFYQANFEEDFDVKIKHFCSNWHNSCESVNNSNCYFKQLARKTRECEELKKSVEHWQMEHGEAKAKGEWACDLLKKKYELRCDRCKLKSDNEELKKQIESDKGLITDAGKQNYQLIQEYDQLKTENEELKRQYKELGQCSRRLKEYFEKEKETLSNKFLKLKQTLTEIKEIVETISEPMGTGKSCNRVILAKQILQKISEVE